MSLRRQTIAGALWSYVDTGFSTLVNFIFLVWLARLLDSTEFGLVAYAGVFIFVGTILVDAGLGAAIVQRRDLRDSHVDTAYWINVALGVFLATVLIAAGPLISATLNEPRLAEIIPPLAMKFVFAGMSAVPAALLRRSMKFRRLAMINALAVLGSCTVGVGIAYRGGGVWSLVYAQLIMSAIVAVGVMVTKAWPLGWRIEKQAFHELARFGGSMLSIRLLTVVGERGTVFLIGYLFGTALLGFYTVGNRFRIDLNTILNSVMARVLMPALSRLQEDRNRLKGAIQEINALRAVTSFPVYLGLSAVAPEVIDLTVGPDWALSGEMLSMVLWMGIAVTVNGAGASALSAIGKPHVVLVLNAVGALGRLVLVGVLARYGILAAILGGVGFVLSYIPVRAHVFARVTGISMRDYLRPFVWPLLAGLTMYGVLSLTRLSLLHDQTTLIRLISLVLLGGLVYAGVLFIADRSVLTRIGVMVQGLHKAKMPDQAR